MNNFDNFFDNLLPLRPLFPFVQSVLPTVFDDSLSYLETLGKVVKALNDTESNVNTLEQAVRAFADELALYGDLTISPVEITYNQETGRYTASMTYSDIVSAIEEGHTMVMHVVDGLHNTEYYSATLKLTETGNGVKVLYWESPAFTVNGVTVFYEPFINENDVAGVTTRTITGSGGGVDTFIIHYNSDTETADKTFAEIVAAIEAEKSVMLIADNFFISNARWTTSGNDEIGYEVISVDFNAFNVVTAPSGKNLGCVTYSVDDTDSWTVARNGFPNESRVNALITAQLNSLELQNNVQYIAQSLTDVEKEQARSNIAAGHFNIGIDADETVITIVDLVTGTPSTYQINKPPYQIPIQYINNVYTTSVTGNDVLEHIKNCIIVFNGLYYYQIGSTISGAFGHAYYACIDPSASGGYVVDIFDVQLNGDNACTVTRYYKDINLLPAVSSSDVGKFMRVNSLGVWVAETVPAAESNSFGGA